jgi:hypothetical protein
LSALSYITYKNDNNKNISTGFYQISTNSDDEIPVPDECLEVSEDIAEQLKENYMEFNYSNKTFSNVVYKPFKTDNV